MKYQFITSCVNSTAELIDNMVDSAIDITYRTFIQYVDIQELSEMFGYVMNSRNGLTLKKDWAVSYHRSTYDGQPCYYLRHSAIEYIFVK